MGLKVVLAPYRNTGSGMSAYPVYVAKALARAGARVILCGFGKRPNELNSVNGVEYQSMGEDPMFLDYAGGVSLTYWYIRRRLKKTILEFDDVDVTHFLNPEATVRSKKSLVVASAWGFSSATDVLRDAHRKFGGLWKMFGMLAELQFFLEDYKAFNLSDGVIGTTTEALRFWKSRINPPITYVPIPVEMPASHDSAVRHKAKDDRLTVMLGERDLDRPRNNVNVVLRALKILLRRRIRNVQLYLIGKYSSRLDSEVSHLRTMGASIVLRSYMPRHEFLELLPATDLCLIPRYIKDQGGYWPLEAMSHGIPVIASDMPSFRDFVLPYKTGMLIDPESPTELASKLQEVIENPTLLTAMAHGARDFVRDFHSIDVVGPSYIKFYESLNNS